jgi:hypothetical protein
MTTTVMYPHKLLCTAWSLNVFFCNFFIGGQVYCLEKGIKSNNGIAIVSKQALCFPVLPSIGEH